MMPDDLRNIPLVRINGEETSLSAYRENVLLIVNVASKCGLTPQYEGLQRLYTDKRPLGLEILGFPANDFEGQEPGTEAEIAEFCSVNYKVEFPLFAKISVVGPHRHPLYSALMDACPKTEGRESMLDLLAKHDIHPASDTDVLWNFEKFVVNRAGEVIARFSPDVTAEDPRLLAVLEKALAR